MNWGAFLIKERIDSDQLTREDNPQRAAAASPALTG
jgi:hypothetical protein